MHGFLALAGVAILVLAPAVRAEERSFDSNGVKISYLDEGKGEVVVLLHGFGMSASEMWTEMPGVQTQILPVFAKEYRVIAPDLRGHGKSEKPHDPKRYGGEVAEDVIRLLDHLKVKKAHLVGYSMGASVVGELLADHSDRWLSATFGGGAPGFHQSKAFTDTMEATAESLEQGKGIGPLIIANAPEGVPKPSPEQAAMISKQFLRDKDQKALAAMLRGGKEMHVTEEQMKAIKVPVLFVYGSRETLLKDLITGAQKVFPVAKITVVEGGDHLSTLAFPEFRNAVLEFVRAHRQ